MSEETQNIVEKPVEAQVKPEVKAETPPSQSEIQEQNWKNFREKREIERKQNEELARRATEKEAEAQALKSAMEALLNKNQPQHNTGFEEEETEDQRIQKKVDAALLKERARYEQERIAREQAEAPERLRKACPDFNVVCSEANIDYLEFHYPEVANAFSRVPDSVEKWQDIYRAVKRFVPQSDQKKEDKRLQQNQMKPQSINAPTTLQGSTSKGAPVLTEQQRAANWERMQKTLKGLSN